MSARRMRLWRICTRSAFLHPRQYNPASFNELRSKGIHLSGWKMITGGAVLPQALARETLELGLDVYAGYGMSEACPEACPT